MSTTNVKSAQAMIDMCWHLVILLAVGVCVSMLPDAALAGGGAPGSNAIEQVFCNIVILLTGQTGKAVATVAIIAVGVGALLGKVSWAMALIVALGVALIFGAATIVQALGGNGSTCAYASITGS
jgi:type IV secretory pathway VirB2 component (pilin)